MREQLKQGQAVLERAAGGLICAEVITARLEGKQVTITHGADGRPLARNMIGQFPAEQTPLGSPEGDVELVLKDLFLSKNVSVAGERVAAAPGRQEMVRVLKAVLRNARRRSMTASRTLWSSCRRTRTIGPTG